MLTEKDISQRGFLFKCSKCNAVKLFEFHDENEAIDKSGFVHIGCDGVVSYIGTLTGDWNEIKNVDNEYLGIAVELQNKIPLYYDDDGNLYIWKHFYWNRIEPKIVDIEIMNILNDQLNYVGYFEKSNKSKIIDAIKMISRKRIVSSVPNEWINTVSGVYNFRDGINGTFASNPKYFFSEPIPHKIGKSDDTPIIDKLFEEWTGKNKQSLYEIASYCLYNSYPIHTLFALHGGGRNGKGQYVTFLARLMGGYNLVTSSGVIKKSSVCSTTIENLVESRFESAKLFRKKLCIIDETDFNMFKNTSIIKKLTGGSAIPGEFKNGAQFDFFNTSKIIVLTNNIPPTLDTTEAYYARWFITDFPNQFSDGKDVIDEIPEIEYENFLFKCLKILPKILDKGFTNRGTMEERKSRYEERSNPFDKFKAEYCVEDVNVFEASRYLHEKFCSYCEIKKLRKLKSVNELNKLLELNGYEVQRKMSIVIEGKSTTMPVVHGLKLKIDSVYEKIKKN